MRWHWKVIEIQMFLVVILLSGCAPLRAQPHTYRAAIMMVLDNRALPYRDVQVHDGCQPNPSDCFAISVIVITGPRSVAGWIGCQSYHKDCTLWLPALGIHAAFLPSLVQDPPWLRTLDQYL
jgi:hypothetical protein